MDKMKVLELKRLRALIVTALYESAKGILLVGTVKKAFSATYSTQEIEKQIDYLRERGYIRDLNPDETLPDDVIIKITDDGQDVVEGTKEDLGVEF